MANGMKLFLNKAATQGLGFGAALQQRGENERAQERMSMQRQQQEAMLPIRQMGAEASVLQALSQAKRVAIQERNTDPVNQTMASLRRVAEEHAKKGDAEAAAAIMAGIQEGSQRLPQIVGAQGQGITDRKVQGRARIAGAETAARQAGILAGRKKQKEAEVLFAPSASMTPEDRIKMEQAKAGIGMGKAIGTQAAKTQFAENPELAADPAAVRQMAEDYRPLVQPAQVNAVKTRARELLQANPGMTPDQALEAAEQELGQ